MKNKKIIVMLFLSIFIFLLVGCKSNIVEDPVRNDLLTYADGISKAMILEENALKDYRSVADKKYEEDNTYVVIKKVVLPKYMKFIEELKSVKPTTEEVEEIHGIYIKVADIRLQAFKQMEEGFEKRDGKLVKETDKMLEEAENSAVEYRRALVKLTEEHNIKLNIK